jgi:hypothetical protein
MFSHRTLMVPQLVRMVQKVTLDEVVKLSANNSEGGEVELVNSMTYL